MNEARQLIEAIASNMAEAKKPLAAIRDVLEDGEALAGLGVTDEDQEIVEDAYDQVERWIDAGLETLDQVGTLDDFSERTPEDLTTSEAAMKKDVVDWYEKNGTYVPQEGEQAPLTEKEVEKLKASI